MGPTPLSSFPFVSPLCFLSLPAEPAPSGTAADGKGGRLTQPGDGRAAKGGVAAGARHGDDARCSDGVERGVGGRALLFLDLTLPLLELTGIYAAARTAAAERWEAEVDPGGGPGWWRSEHQRKALGEKQVEVDPIDAGSPKGNDGLGRRWLEHRCKALGEEQAEVNPVGGGGPRDGGGLGVWKVEEHSSKKKATLWTAEASESDEAVQKLKVRALDLPETENSRHGACIQPQAHRPKHRPDRFALQRLQADRLVSITPRDVYSTPTQLSSVRFGAVKKLARTDR
uniref:Uncharacterized protein n=1 Tax=Oryza punctata TaxID=4537 RepID=A0A0E0JHH4_ORYPU